MALRVWARQVQILMVRVWSHSNSKRTIWTIIPFRPKKWAVQKAFKTKFGEFFSFFFFFFDAFSFISLKITVYTDIFTVAENRKSYRLSS